MASQASGESQETNQEFVNDTVQYILSQDYNKHPIRRQDIVKNPLKNNGKSFKHTMEEVTKVFKEVFGMDLIEIEHSASTKYYILVNAIKNSEGLKEIKWSPEVEANQVLLMLVLSFIFMSGGVVKEEALWNFLTNLEILTSRPHPYFGDVRKLLTQEYVRQLYIEYIRLPDTDPPKYEFRWGARSEREVSKRALLKFMSMIHGNCDMKNWTVQYQEVLQSEEDGK